MVLGHLFKTAKYFALAFMVYLLSWVFYLRGFFESIYFLDDVFHVLGGISVGYAFYFSISYFESENFLRLNKLFKILFVISLTALVAVTYEFYQFAMTFITNIPFQPSLEDTLLDLFLGLIGGFFVLFLFELKDYVTSK